MIYDAAIKKFMTLPGVTSTPDGRFSYPSDLTPPKAPDDPIEEETEENMPLGDMASIYAEKSPEEFVAEMTKKLQSAKISLTGSR